jgi:hypothetical protein
VCPWAILKGTGLRTPGHCHLFPIFPDPLFLSVFATASITLSQALMTRQAMRLDKASSHVGIAGLAGSTHLARYAHYWADAATFSRFYWQSQVGTHYSIWLFENGARPRAGAIRSGLAGMSEYGTAPATERGGRHSNAPSQGGDDDGRQHQRA